MSAPAAAPHRTISQFCDHVCMYIRFRPDHEAITAELTAHLEPERYIGRCPEQVEEFLAQEIAPVLEKYAAALGGKETELKV